VGFGNAVGCGRERIDLCRRSPCRVVHREWDLDKASLICGVMLLLLLLLVSSMTFECPWIFFLFYSFRLLVVCA
jgi:hypothetical protein